MNISEFNEKIQSGIYVVDFYTNRCAPCKVLASKLEELKDKLNIIKVDADFDIEIADKFNISAVPTLVFFKDGKQFDKRIGILSTEVILEIVSKA